MGCRSSIACLIITALLNPSLAAKPAPNPKIIIVGAGASGIAAAVHLIEYGFEDITLLEVEPRIGGRINTVPFAENVIDLGAQWCHGEKGNDVYDLAFEAGLLAHSNAVEEYINYTRSNGEVLPTQLVKRLQQLISEAKQKSKEEASSYEGSIGSLIKAKFENLMALGENNDIDKSVAEEFYAAFEKLQSLEESADRLNMVSAQDYYLYDAIAGDYFMNWKDKGYKEFLRLLMKSNETGRELGVLDSRIKFSKKVKRIFWQRNDYKTLVTCEDGEEFLADHVIVTVSLGVLKANHESMFEPALPAEKQKAIEALSFGIFNKIFLEFPTRFWPQQWGGITFLWRQNELQALQGTNHSWLQGLFMFNTLPYQPYVLEGWIFGESAREIENISLEQLEMGAVLALRKFFNKTVEVPNPVNIIASRWFTNPNFRGCYSYHSLETAKEGISNQFLANTLRGVCDLKNYQDLCEKPVLQFAGEATESRHYATVHGALETGYREAQKIRDYYAYGPPSVREQYHLKDM